MVRYKQIFKHEHNDQQYMCKENNQTFTVKTGIATNKVPSFFLIRLLSKEYAWYNKGVRTG